MNTEEDIFEAAAALPGEERAAYLDGACAGEPEVRARIEALLRSHEVRGFMDGATRTADAEGEEPVVPLETGGRAVAPGSGARTRDDA